MSTKILVRFDDICPTMDWEQWQRAMAIVETNRIRPLLGVIPDCQDPDLQLNKPQADFWQYIAQLQKQGFAIAMHGERHVFDSYAHGIVNRTPHSEFAGHSYEVQYEKIKRGKETLRQNGIETDIFFAPAHSYDENTLKALAANGFRYISDGKSKKPFLRQGILCIPCRSGGCPQIGKKGYYTAVVHANEWTRPDKAAGYQALQRLCRDHRSEICNFTDYSAQPMGTSWIQRVDERLYLLYEYSIRPVLSKTKHFLLR